MNEEIDLIYFLPQAIQDLLFRVGLKSIREIRLRLGNQVFLNVNGERKSFNIGQNSIKKEDFEKIITKITEHSIYAHSETMKNGYITTKNGVRVGLSGKAVIIGDEVKIIKEITSLCIRIPHEIVGCSDKVFNRLFYNERLCSVLIVSPPGMGKTTLLRDLIRNISIKLKKNILIVDERGELCSDCASFSIGETVDVLLNAPKEYGFNVGVRTLCPDVIAVDELMSESDIAGAMFAKMSGTEIFATVHGSSILDVKKKKIFKGVFENSIFNYAVILKDVGREFEIIQL